MKLVVEVSGKTGWDEVSRYNADALYTSTRHTPPKTMTGRALAEEDKKMFERPTSYGRAARVREIAG